MASFYPTKVNFVTLKSSKKTPCYTTCMLLLQAQLSGLGPLVVPKRLLHRGKSDREGGKEGESGELNLTDQEKAVTKDTTNLLQVSARC